MTNDRVAVVGASGFIATALVDRLRATGVPVARFTRSRPFINGDGTLNDELTSAATIYWLASSIRPATADGLTADVDADHQALATLLDRLTADGSTARIVALGSGGTVYDTASPPPYREDDPAGPSNTYGQAMFAIEELVRAHPGNVVLRVANAYGPGQPARRGQGVIAHWLTSIAANEPIHVIGPDDLARDYVYIDDVVDALRRVHGATSVPPTVNIGSGQPTTLGALLDAVRSVVAPREVEVIRQPSRGFDAPSTWLDVGLADRSLGWRPSTSLIDGLQATWHRVAATSPAAPTSPTSPTSPTRSTNPVIGSEVTNGV
jgi:UDP-glucose 4-epimerase